MKLTTSFKLAVIGERIEGYAPRFTMEHCEHLAYPLACSLERAAAFAFFRNPDATHCIVSTKGVRDAVTIARTSKTEAQWNALRERKA